MSNAADLDYQSLSGGTPTTTPATYVVLSVMMFLQYAVWGLWLVILPKYLQTTPALGGLGFSQTQVAWIIGAAGAIGAISAPFIAGQLADRFLNAEIALGLLLLIGGVVNVLLAYAHGYVPFLLLSILYSVLYMPTLSLTNSVSFANLSNPQKQFPPVRTLGTIGWAAAAYSFPKIWLALPVGVGIANSASNEIINTHRIVDSLIVSGVLSVAYGLFCLFGLPKTPPKANAGDPLAFLKAFGLLRHRGFLVLTLVSLPVATIHMAFYFRFAPFLTDAVGVKVENVGLISILGQATEIVFLFVLAGTLRRLGFRTVLTLGALGYCLRYLAFWIGHPFPLVLLGQCFHGLCYAFFFAAAYIYVEKIAPSDIRHSAQTVFGIIILGLGPVVAGLYAQALGEVSFEKFWLIQALIAAAVVPLVALSIREPTTFVSASGDAPRRGFGVMPIPDLPVGEVGK